MSMLISYLHEQANIDVSLTLSNGSGATNDKKQNNISKEHGSPDHFWNFNSFFDCCFRTLMNAKNFHMTPPYFFLLLSRNAY